MPMDYENEFIACSRKNEALHEIWGGFYIENDDSSLENDDSSLENDDSALGNDDSSLEKDDSFLENDDSM